MILGAVLQASSYSRAQMIVARIVSGVGMGAINSTVPVFQAEFSPKASRGLCMNPLLQFDFEAHIIQMFACNFLLLT